jgi:type II secretory pathway predicted ATPase ExeA
MLLGQPTLAAKVALGTVAALEQRTTVRRAMTGMSSEETAGYVHRYVHHHLQIEPADPTRC